MSAFQRWFKVTDECNANTGQWSVVHWVTRSIVKNKKTKKRRAATMETFLRFKGDVCLGWKWLRMWQISPAYTGTSSEVDELWMHCTGTSSFRKRFIFVAKYPLLDVLMHIALCEQSFQVTPCRLTWVIFFLCSYTSAKTTRKPYNYNWHSWHQQGPN